MLPAEVVLGPLAGACPGLVGDASNVRNVRTASRVSDEEVIEKNCLLNTHDDDDFCNTPKLTRHTRTAQTTNRRMVLLTIVVRWSHVCCVLHLCVRIANGVRR